MTSTSGVWVPADQQERPELTRVRQWVRQPWDAPEALAHLDDLDLVCLQKWIRLPRTQWQPVLDALHAEDLIHLIQLLTLAEARLDGCTAGEDSAAIHAFRQHREHWGKPDKALLRWIRAQNDNRYLPYGPAL